LITLLVSCEGANCIDANDFGEFDVHTMAIESQKTLCKWEETDTSDGNGDYEIERCLRDASGARSIRNPDIDCTITFNEGTSGYAKVKEALKSQNITKGFMEKYFTLNNESQCGTDYKKLLTAFYAEGLEDCISTCETKHKASNPVSEDVYEPEWKPADLILEVGREFYIKATGEIDLLGEKERSVQYLAGSINMNKKTTINTIFAIKTNTDMTFSGNWITTKNGVVDKNYGEIDGNQPNLQKRIEFLRRGVMYLQPLPSVKIQGMTIIGEVNEIGSYTGPDVELDKTKISCLVNENLPYDGYPTTCKVDYGVEELPDDFSIAALTESQRIALANNELYKLDPFMSKSKAGYVLTPDIIDYMTKMPLKGYSCATTFNANYGIYRRNCDDGKIDRSIGFNNGYLVPKAFVFTNETQGGNDDYQMDINGLVFPVKIMVRVYGGIRGECKVGIKMPAALGVNDLDPSNEVDGFYKVTIPANDKWHYINDIKNKPIIFGKNTFFTIKETTEGRVNVRNENQYNLALKVVSPSFDEGNRPQWTAAPGASLYPNTFVVPPIPSKGTPNEIIDTENHPAPCGEGMVVMLMPQNEIVIKESGFVSIKSFLKDKIYTCNAADDGSEVFCQDGANGGGNPPINRTFNLKYTILNPNVNASATTFAVKSENFYEKSTSEIVGSSNKYYPKFNDLMIPVSAIGSVSTTTWSSKFFVRKGQVIRFDETSWFGIEGSNGDGFEVKEKFLKYDNFNIKKNIGEGLIMHIEKRPSFLCTGEAEESIFNSSCQKIKKDDGTVDCRVPYSQYCSTMNSQAEVDRYCPLGCYKVEVGGGGEAEHKVEINEGWGIALLKGDSTIKNQSFYVDNNEKESNNCSYPPESLPESFEDPMSVQKCIECRNYIESNPDASIELVNKVSLTQCYDLENYTGSIKVLENKNPFINSETGEGDYNKKTFDLLGVKKLNSIFSQDAKYGNLEGSSVDSQYQQSDGTYTKFIYNSPTELKTEEPKIIKFLTLNIDDNLDFSPSFAEDIGRYKITLMEGDKFMNGKQLSVLIAHKGWDKKNFSQQCETGFCVKQYVVKYDTSKESEGGLEPNTNYGKELSDVNDYEFDSFGDLVSKAKISEKKLILTSIKNGLTSFDLVEPKEYEDLRIYFKVIDRLQYAPKETFNDDCPLNTIAEYETRYSCTGATYDELKTITCVSTINNVSETISACPISATDTACSKTSAGSYITPPYSIKVKVGCNHGLYYNNNGGYSVKIQSPKVFTSLNSVTDMDSAIKTNVLSWGVTKIQGFTIRRLLNPFMEVMEGINMGLLNFRGGFEPCVKEIGETVSSKCTYYNPKTDIFDPQFGAGCTYDQPNCFITCNLINESDPGYAGKCKIVNDNGGYIKNFYSRVILDSQFHAVVRILLTLMMTFLGLYHLIGMSEITSKEMLTRITKIGIIYLFIGETGWFYYNRFIVQFFVRGADYLSYAVAGAFEETPGLTREFTKGIFLDKTVLFGATDRNLALIFSAEVNYKILGLLFTSYLGWLYVILLYSALINYVFASLNALVLFMMSKFLLMVMLTFGPIFFVLLIFEKTKTAFDKWVMALVGHVVEQVSLMVGLSLFNMLVYNFIKFVLNFRVCWTQVWIVELPLLGSIKLFNFWRATTGTTTVTTAMNAMPGLFRVLIIYIIADLMKGFIELVRNFSNDIAKSGLKLGDRVGGILEEVNRYKEGDDGIKDSFTKGLNAKRDSFFKKMGYQTEEEEMKEQSDEKKNNIKIRQGENAGKEARNDLAAKAHIESTKKAKESAEKFVNNKGDAAKNKHLEEKGQEAREVAENAFKSKKNNKKLSPEELEKGAREEGDKAEKEAKENADNIKEAESKATEAKEKAQKDVTGIKAAEKEAYKSSYNEMASTEKLDEAYKNAFTAKAGADNWGKEASTKADSVFGFIASKAWHAARDGKASTKADSSTIDKQNEMTKVVKKAKDKDDKKEFDKKHDEKLKEEGHGFLARRWAMRKNALTGGRKHSGVGITPLGKTTSNYRDAALKEQNEKKNKDKEMLEYRNEIAQESRQKKIESDRELENHKKTGEYKEDLRDETNKLQKEWMKENSFTSYDKFIKNGTVEQKKAYGKLGEKAKKNVESKYLKKRAEAKAAEEKDASATASEEATPKKTETEEATLKSEEEATSKKTETEEATPPEAETGAEANDATQPEIPEVPSEVLPQPLEGEAIPPPKTEISAKRRKKASHRGRATIPDGSPEPMDEPEETE
jgi:type IV secretory pathway VirB6-like protein